MMKQVALPCRTSCFPGIRQPWFLAMPLLLLMVACGGGTPGGAGGEGNPPAAHERDSVYLVAAVPPAFPGGEPARVRYMQESLRYPASAKEDAVYGTVYASFVVRRDGRITDAEVLRGVREDLDREVLRVLSGMPSWEPARNEGGEAVSMRFNLPVRFSLLDEAPVAGLAPSREGITLVMVGEERFEWPEGRATRLEDLVPSGEIESVTVLQGEEALLEFGYESVILIERKSEPRQ